MKDRKTAEIMRRDDEYTVTLTVTSLECRTHTTILVSVSLFQTNFGDFSQCTRSLAVNLVLDTSRKEEQLLKPGSTLIDVIRNDLACRTRILGVNLKLPQNTIGF